MYSAYQANFNQKTEKSHTLKYDIDNPTKYGDVQGPYLPTRNQKIPAKIIQEDQNSGVLTDSLRFYQGTKFTPQSCKWFSFPKLGCRVNTLKRFYPRQGIVVKTQELYHEKKEQYTEYALATTALSWFAIFQFARRGKVLPIFRQYGRFFGTHRVFRHYLYTAVFPLALAYYSLNNKFVYHINHLWTIHANRLNNKILDDSMGSRLVQLSGPFKVNIFKSVIGQETDIQEHSNARLSLTELGEDGLQDFQLQTHVDQKSEGEGDAQADEGATEQQGSSQSKEDADEQQPKDSFKIAKQVAASLQTKTGAQPDSVTSKKYVKQLGEPIDQDDEDNRKQQLSVENEQQLRQYKKNVLSQSAPNIEEAPAEVAQKDIKKYKARQDLIRGEAAPKRKLKISELDFDNIDIDSINIDELDLEEFGLDDESIDDATYRQQNQPRA